MILHIIENDWDALMLQFLIILVDCVAVIISMAIDLYFGIQVSKKNGGFVRSKGLQISTQKLVRYLSVMMLMVVLDVINPVFVYLDSQPIPVFCFLGAFVLIYTEYKSIKEKFDDDFQKELQDNAIELLNFIKNNKDLIEQLKSKNNESSDRKVPDTSGLRQTD